MKFDTKICWAELCDTLDWNTAIILFPENQTDEEGKDLGKKFLIELKDCPYFDKDTESDLLIGKWIEGHDKETKQELKHEMLEASCFKYK